MDGTVAGENKTSGQTLGRISRPQFSLWASNTNGRIPREEKRWKLTYVAI